MRFLSRLFGGTSGATGRLDSNLPVFSTLMPTWVSMDGRVGVVGESYYQDALNAAAGGKATVRQDHLVLAVLKPEPENPHDGKAVAVCTSGKRVGYLSRSIAAAYHEPLVALWRNGRAALCWGRIVGGWRNEHSEGDYGIWLHLGEASNLFMKNDAPANPLFGSRRLQVTCDEHYQTALGLYGRPTRSLSYPVWFTLHRVERNPHRARSSEPACEVKLDGEIVGYLSPQSSAEYLSLLDDAPFVTVEGRVKSSKKPGVDFEGEVKLPHLEELNELTNGL